MERGAAAWPCDWDVSRGRGVKGSWGVGIGNRKLIASITTGPIDSEVRSSAEA